MSDDDLSNVPAPRDRREAVREKAQQVHARHTMMSRIRIGALSFGGLVVVGAVVAGVVFAVSSSAGRPQVAPQNETEGGFAVTSVAGVAALSAAADEGSAAMQSQEPVETPSADPTSTTSASTVSIRIYVDYLAAGAKQFDTANSQQLASWVSEGAATLSYYPVAMLTAKSNGTKYSLRAAAAAACVATYSPDAMFAFNHNLLGAQPDANSDGLSDDDLASIAGASSVDDPKSVRTCIEDGEFLTWAKSSTDAAVLGIPDSEGLTLTGTPMILVNGDLYQGALDDPAEFSQFVQAQASDAYFSTPTPTPSATSTPAS